MCDIFFLIRLDSIPKQYIILEIKSLQITTELADFTLYNHTSGQHIRSTSHLKSFNSIQTLDSGQNNNSMIILDIRWPTKQKILAKKRKLTSGLEPATSRDQAQTHSVLNRSAICPHIYCAYCRISSPSTSRDSRCRGRGGPAK